MFFMLSCLLIAALLSPAGKGLTSWLLFVMFNCVFVTFPCGILGLVWYLIVSILDLCRLSYFHMRSCTKNWYEDLVKQNIVYFICGFATHIE